MADPAGVVGEGSGDPVTVFASGGLGGGNYEWMRDWSRGVTGTRACFRYAGVEPWLPGRPPRREAERDAAETRAVADQLGATRAVGVSRGARALLGVLAEDPMRFERLVLVMPPGGTSAGRYREWLAELPRGAGSRAIGAGRLILAMRGDSGHPVALAEEWAARLGARLKVFPSMHRLPTVLDVIKAAMEDFLNGAK